MLKKIVNQITDSLFLFEKEKNQLGVSFHSPTIRKTNQFLATYPLASLFPYESYDPDSGLYHNRKSVGFILEAMPLTGCSEETITLLNSLIADSLPEGAIFQVLLWASPKVEDVFQAWREWRCDKNDMLKTLSDWRVDYLREGVWRSLIPNDTYLIRDFRLYLNVVIPKEEGWAIDSLLSLRDEMLNTLKSIGMGAKNLSVERFMVLMSDLINPTFNLTKEKSSWNPNDSLSLQITSPETSLQVTKEGLVLNEGELEVQCFTVRDYPNLWAQWGMGDLIGDLYRDALRIPCPYLVSFAIYIPSREKTERHAAIKTIRSDQKAHSPLARFMPVIHKVSQDWNQVAHRLEEGDRLVECVYQVILYAPRDQGTRSETLLKNLYQAKGWKLSKPRYFQLPFWLSSLPLLVGEGGLWDDLKRLGRVKTVLSTTAANLLPFQGEWKGMSIPRVLLTGRRGQMMWWDNFSNEEGNYNVAIVGKSGSGKSVFMQEIMTSLLGSGGRVWVLDIGRSFQKTCELLGGEFMEFTPSSTICINPFTFVGDFDEALSLLKPLFSMMAKPSQKTTDHENALLEQALKSVWQQKQHQATVTQVAEWLLHHEDARAKDLGTMLFPYTKEGMYGRFFEGHCTLNLQSSLCVLELEELKAKKDLQEVVLLVLMYQVTEAMYRGKRLQPMACIIDEAWDLLRGEQSGEFVETGCRRARKYRGAFITGTQSVNDYYKTPAAKAAFENSDWLCLLSQKPESIDELKVSKRLHLDGFKERLLKSVKTVQGAYAEIFIEGPPGYAVGRLMLDPFSRVLYSSKAQDYAEVKALQAKGFSLVEAISYVAKQSH